MIVSAYGDMANIRTAMNRGAFDFLTKPIDFTDLETTIAKTIRHIDVLREARRRQSAAERAHAMLSRYFSPNLAERLASDASALDLGGKRREVAVALHGHRGLHLISSRTLDPALFERGAERISVRDDGRRFRARGHGCQDRRRCDPCAFRSAGRSAGPQHARAVACTLALDECSERFRAFAGAKRGGDARTRPASASIPARRSSAISAAGASSTTPPMATPSTRPRGWRRPTRCSARASA